MGFLFELDTPVIVALVVSFCIAAGGQLLHVLFLSTHRDARPFSLVKLYEVLLFVHLLLAAGTANSVHSGYGVALFRLKAFSFPVESLLWIDAAAALLGLALAIAHRRPIMTSEIALMALITPPSIDIWVIWCRISSLAMRRSSFFAWELRLPSMCAPGGAPFRVYRLSIPFGRCPRASSAPMTRGASSS